MRENILNAPPVTNDGERRFNLEMRSLVPVTTDLDMSTHTLRAWMTFSQQMLPIHLMGQRTTSFTEINEHTHAGSGRDREPCKVHTWYNPDIGLVLT